MTESSKPREWVLSSHYSYDYDAMKWSVYGGIISHDALPEKVKVIEKSAHDAALARIVELESELAEQARINGIGQQKELKLKTQLAELEQKYSDLNEKYAKLSEQNFYLLDLIGAGQKLSSEESEEK